MHGKRIGYKRASTVDQSTERQLDGMVVDKSFEDKQSGRDTNRPGLEAMIDYAREGDTIYVHSLDRLARNLQDLLRLVSRLTSKGVRIESLKEKLSFDGDDNPQSTLMLSVMGAFAAFERSLILSRQREA